MLLIKLKGNPETEINPIYCRPPKLTKFDIFPHKAHVEITEYHIVSILLSDPIKYGFSNYPHSPKSFHLPVPKIYFKFRPENSRVRFQFDSRILFRDLVHQIVPWVLSVVGPSLSPKN